LEQDKDDEKPFFAYVAYTAPHDPLHAPKDYVDKYKGKYDQGFNVLISERFDTPCHNLGYRGTPGYLLNSAA
jgi:arylsulfatase